MVPRPPKFCTNCGTALPSGTVRFCIACGHPFHDSTAEHDDEGAPGNTGPTVRLANARVAQQVIGGTVKLPVSGAVPPGLWVRDEVPGPADVVAIYPPLRPVSGGWSGVIGRGWQQAGSEAKGTQMLFHFLAEVAWFPANGCGAGLHLRTEVAASSRAWEGKGRRGFRFGLRRDGPMQITAAAWHNPTGQRLANQPLPQIQLMAPPRVPRVSDLDDAPELMVAPEAALWVQGSQAPGAYRLYRDQLMQEHTPVGRGITLIPLHEGREHGQPWWSKLLAGAQPLRYRARILHPFVCGLAEWAGRLHTIREEARSLGLDLDPALAAEWWLDRQGYDGVIFTAAQERYAAERVLIVFQRGQLVKIKD